MSQRLSTCLDSIDSPAGRRRVVEFLHTQPFPHYEPVPDAPGLLVRLEADGKRTVGRFVNRSSESRRNNPRGDESTAA